MSRVFQAVVDALEEVSGVDPRIVTLESHIFDDLGVDSLDFLDINFEIDSALGTNLPIEEWLDGNNPSQLGDMMRVKSFVAFIEQHLKG